MSDNEKKVGGEADVVPTSSPKSKIMKILGGTAIAVFLLMFLLMAVGKVLLGNITNNGVLPEVSSGGVAVAPSANGSYDGSFGIGGSDKGTANPDMPTPIVPPTTSASIAQDKIIKTGSASIESPEAYKTLAAVKTSADKFGAFYENESLSRDNNKNEYASIVIRIPAAKFDLFVKELNNGAFGKVLNLNINQSDQSKTYRDLKADLTSTEKELAAVEAILDKAKTVDEILTIREQSVTLRAEVNRLKVALNDIDTSVSYSTLSLAIQSPANVQAQNNWWTSTLQSALNTLQQTVTVMIVFATAIFPWALVFGVLFAIYKFIRRYKKK